MLLEGLKVFQVPEAAVCERAVRNTFSVGYRLTDTTDAYFNEETVGAAVAKSGSPQEKLFITTKLWIQNAGYERAKKPLKLHGEAVQGREDPDHRHVQLLPRPAD